MTEYQNPELTKKIQEHYQRVIESGAKGKIGYDEFLQFLDTQHNLQREEILNRNKLEAEDADKNYQAKVLDFRQDVEDFFEEFGVVVAPWLPSLWQKYFEAVNPVTRIPEAIRIGDLKGKISIPAMLSLSERKHIIILSNSNTLVRGKQLLQSITARILATYPITQISLSLIDPVGLSSNLPFKDLPEKIRGAGVLIEPEEIQNEMRDIAHHIKTITQDHLKQLYVNLDTFNEASDQKIPYRFVCVADFPARFEKDSLERLKSIAEQGIRTGTYLILHVNGDENLPPDFDAIRQYSTVIELKTDENLFTIDGASIKFTPDGVPGAELFNNLINKLNREFEREIIVGTEKPPEVTQVQQTYLFLSYSRSDNDSMQQIKNDLTINGINVWTDENLTPGTPDWEREIEKAIRGAGGLLILLSPDAKQSKWVMAELRYAERFGITPFPVLLRGDEPSSVPMELALTQYTNLRDEAIYAKNFNILLHALNAHLSMPHVFLSYTSSDSSFARKLRDDLRLERLKIWMKDDLVTGNDKQRTIEKAILEAGSMIILLSPEARDERSVRLELNYARSCNKGLFPVLIAGDERASIPMGLANYEYTDMRDETSYRQGLRQLVPAIAAYLRSLE